MLVRAVSVPEVLPLLTALTAELASGGYGEAGTFGYSPARLAASEVHLVGAEVAGEVVGIGGIELAGDGTAELKRFYVEPAHRGTDVASAVMHALLDHAARHGVHTVRLETGDAQHAAIRFYTRHGFAPVDRFGPYVDSPTSVCLEHRLSPPRPQTR